VSLRWAFLATAESPLGPVTKKSTTGGGSGSTTSLMECTPSGGQLRHHSMDSLPGELLLERDWTAIAKGGMLGVFAEFERSLITARVRNGIKHAKKHGTKTGRPFGRPKIGYRERQKILRLHREGQTQRSIAKAVGVSRGTVQNVLREES